MRSFAWLVPLRCCFLTASCLVLSCAAGGGADVVQSGIHSGNGGSAGKAGNDAAAGEGGAASLPPPEENGPPVENGGAGGAPAGGGAGAPGSGGGSGTAGKDGGAGKGGAAGGGAAAGSAGAAGEEASAGAGGEPGGSEECEADDGWPAESRAFECEVLAIVNEKRKAGASCEGTSMAPTSPVVMESHLRKAARAHAKDMADKGYFSHTSLTGKTSFKRMGEAGYKGGTLGENIANGQDDPVAVMAAWMKSGGHCKVLMNPKYKHVGIGFARDAGGDTYWVEDFGAP